MADEKKCLAWCIPADDCRMQPAGESGGKGGGGWSEAIPLPYVPSSYDLDEEIVIDREDENGSKIGLYQIDTLRRFHRPTECSRVCQPRYPCRFCGT